MRILIIHNYYQQTGGEDTVVANERALLERSGHQVELYTAHNNEISGLLSKLNAFSRVTYNKNARRSLGKRLAGERFDAVHVHNTFPLISPSIYDACAAADVPVIQTLHNYRIVCAGALLFRDGRACELCLDGRPYRAVMHRCYRGSMLGSFAVANAIDYHRRHHTWSTKVTRFIALTEFARSKFIDAGLPPDRIIVKPNFIEDPGYFPRSDSRNGALYVGRLSREKGVSHLLDAWSRIDARLRIIGDGPERATLQQQAPANVIFEGAAPLERVRAAMRSAQFIVMPSVCYEGLPLTLVEAFANGLPVVASRLGSLSELVDDNINGCLVAPGDPGALASAVNALLHDRILLTAMSDAARRRYETVYTPELNLRQLLNIYAEAISDVKTKRSSNRVAQRE